ncbi:MAG: cell division protein SepF [Selenomonadaceae bacterium]|nr:cell division protein SepF [Selenomonadaceae bacterium]
MGFIDKVCGKFGLVDPEEEALNKELAELEKKEKEEERELARERERAEREQAREREREREQYMRDRRSEGYGGRDGGEAAVPHNVVNFQNAASARDAAAVTSYKMKVVVIEPKSFDDAQQVANCLREKRPVVINFEKTDSEAAKRIIDFISGTTYALNGEIKKVGDKVFLCAPSNVNVSYTEEEKKNTADMPWLKR